MSNQELSGLNTSSPESLNPKEKESPPAPAPVPVPVPIKRRLLVIVATGATHRREPCRASQMWMGPYHTACIRYAEYLVGKGGENRNVGETGETGEIVDPGEIGNLEEIGEIVDEVRILHPKLGLLTLDQEINPTILDNNGMDRKSLNSLASTVTKDGSYPDILRRQVIASNLLERRVVVLAAESWVKICSQVWSDISFPFKGVGMGDQISKMNAILGGSLKPIIQSPLSTRATMSGLGESLKKE